MQRPVKSGASTLQNTFATIPVVRDLLDPAPDAIAVALSGGPDSMALLYLLSQLHSGCPIHAITVDHGLRKNSGAEARQVGAWVKGWDNVTHHVLKWSGVKPDNAIMEQARDARYDLMAKWCRKHKITQLWLGHNQTDQAETFLFRLAKGSGLDGLGGMKDIQAYKASDLLLVRPLMHMAKADLQKFCTTHKIPHVQDPTNTNLKYARSRLRQSLPVLEAEGLSEKRLVTTATRLARARDALDHYTNLALDDALISLTRTSAALDLVTMAEAPEEIRLRLVRSVLGQMGFDGYGPRLEPLEDRLAAFFADVKGAKRFTLGGFLFSRRAGRLVIEREKP